MIHPAAAATAGSTSHGHGSDWWSTAVSCSPDQLPGFGAGWSAAADGNRSRSGNAASSESPGSNSLATGGSSITFQEPAGVADPGAVVGPQPATGLAAGWNQPYYLDESGFHGYMSSSRGDQVHLGLSSTSSNNSLMLQEPHDPNHQFLSNLGLELLSSPTSPSGGFRSSSLLRSLTEPSAAVKPSSLGFQQYQQPTMNPPSSIREAVQFTNNTPFWNPSTGFAAAAEGAANLGTARPPSAQSRTASLAAKSALEGAGDSSSIIMKKANTDPTPLKKARTGTPSPLPTFKVRKEKLGDRITALQQLVSPFGKTDTASVLHETIEYIKFLHAQVGSLSAPYLKNRQQQVPHLKVSRDDGGEAAAAKGGDLTGRGLCLVPISSTFAVASETPIDIWTPFGGAFR
ncbi:Transcription factor bHLH112 [Dichanthelium oligosanthes]|uniref:Transcription factor bHLH112 n=1 Tax=Dichanthelium oligosanthes TaxID=888268 RepID=A0A1E5VW81_9POAL|nr:Transcription factor bHLH112 [Dichanthelium oligosanthes]